MAFRLSRQPNPAAAVPSALSGNKVVQIGKVLHEGMTE